MKTLMKALVSIICFLVALAVIAVGATFVLLDPNKHREEIAAFLSKGLNRPVTLEGKIGLGLSANGLMLTVEKVSVANPEWASRKTMASIGSFELGIALPPLLKKQLNITSVQLGKADILLETNADGKVNWELGNPEKQAAAKEGAAKETGTSQETKTKQMANAQDISIAVDRVRVSDSQFATRAKDGKVTSFVVEDFDIVRKGGGLAINLTSSLDGAPITIKATTPSSDLSSKVWPFEGVVTYATYKLAMDGTVNLDKKTAKLDKVTVTSGSSDIAGTFAANWGGAIPAVRADLTSQSFYLADFTAGGKQPASASSNKAGDNKGAATAKANGLFSRDPLPLDGLKAAEAEVSLKFKKLILGNAKIQDANMALSLRGGNLMISVPKAMLGQSAVSFKTLLEGSSTPALQLSFSAPQLHFADLQNALGVDEVVKGDGVADFSMTSRGKSLHELAANADGSLRVLSQGGQVVLSALGNVFSGLAQLVAPGASGVVAMNCLATDMVIRNGVMGGHGLLLDTPVSTAKLSGDINLGAENLQMLFETRPKAGKVGNYVPPVRIGGGLASPSFGVDERAVAGKVMGALLGDGVSSNVPVPQASTGGVNACLEALQKPVQATTPTTTNAIKDALQGGKANPKDIGKQLLRGLLGN